MPQYDNDIVSVITPVYNVGKVIGKTINSMLAQGYKDLEIVLVDDCSKDNSAEVIAEYTAKYPNIVYHRQEKNGGAAVARNTALKLAKGRYVAFLDSDDMWCEGKIKKQLAFMKEKDATICCTAMDCIDEEDKPLNSVRGVREKISYKFLLKNTMISTLTFAVSAPQQTKKLHLTDKTMRIAISLLCLTSVYSTSACCFYLKLMPNFLWRKHGYLKTVHLHL